MNYDQRITELADQLKADKSLMQPFKNYAVSDLLRVQAIIRMAASSTNLQPPEGMTDCTCPKGGTRIDCPQHGVKA